nr:hypothetical protein 495p2_00015 [Serratia proteamaculans]
MLRGLQRDRMMIWGAVDEPRVQAIFRHDTNKGDGVTNNAKGHGVQVPSVLGKGRIQRRFFDVEAVVK